MLWSTILKAALKSNSTIHLIINLSIYHFCLGSQYMLSAIQYKHAESLLLICLQRNSIVFFQTHFFPAADYDR